MRIVRYYPRAISGDGGMTGAVRRWSEGMTRAGADVTIAFADDGRGGGASRGSDGVSFVPVRHAGGAGFQLPVELDTVLRGADLLVLHSAWTAHNVWAGSVARRLGIPYVLEPRGAYDPHIVRRHRIVKQAWWLGFERALVRGARAVHLFFDAERAHLERLGYHGAVVVAPNGVDIMDTPRWDGGSGGYVLWMGRFDPEHKGIDTLVRAVRLLPNESRPTVLLHGPDRRDGKPRMAALVRDLALEPWVKIREPVHGRAKYELLARARGFVYPSRWEGFGNSVAEAASVGVPTLVTPYPFGRHLHAKGAAILAEPTPAGLAAGLEALLSPAAASVGCRAAQVVREEITWDRVVRSWLTQVEAIL